MFTKQTSEHPIDGLEVKPEVALAEACARNSPIEVITFDNGVPNPPAKGRMIERTPDYVVCEQLQIIGRNTRITVGSVVDCYFNYFGTLLQFRGEVIETGVPVRLNEQHVVPAVKIRPIGEILAGQRRTVFRVSLGSKSQSTCVEIWRQSTADALLDQARLKAKQAAEAAAHAAEMEAKQAPARGPHRPRPAPKIVSPDSITLTDALEPARPDFDGVLVDANDTGIGFTLYGCSYTRFQMYERLWLRITLDAEHPALLFQVEVRQRRPVGDDGTRLGTVIVPDKDPRKHAAAVRELIGYLNELQRAARKAG